jgi:hypothetical protein
MSAPASAEISHSQLRRGGAIKLGLGEAAGAAGPRAAAAGDAMGGDGPMGVGADVGTAPRSTGRASTWAISTHTCPSRRKSAVGIPFDGHPAGAPGIERVRDVDLHNSVRATCDEDLVLRPQARAPLATEIHDSHRGARSDAQGVSLKDGLESVRRDGDVLRVRALAS